MMVDMPLKQTFLRHAGCSNPLTIARHPYLLIHCFSQLTNTAGSVRQDLLYVAFWSGNTDLSMFIREFYLYLRPAFLAVPSKFCSFYLDGL